MSWEVLFAFFWGAMVGASFWPVKFWLDWKRTRTRKYYE